MSIPSTSQQELSEHITRLGICTGDAVMVYSRLISFGHLEGGVEGAYAALRSVVGSEGTIAVPTFRLFAPASTVYDRRSSPSERCGQLSEFVRLLPGARRSRCPMHSHAALGPLAEILETSLVDCSLGHGSDFTALQTAGFKQLFLGCEFPDSATFVAHLMAVNGRVPYRIWIDLPRDVMLEDGQTERIFCRYYGRKDRDRNVEDWNIARALLRERGLLREEKVHFGSSYAFDLNDLDAVLSPYLNTNPAGLLVRKEVVA